MRARAAERRETRRRNRLRRLRYAGIGLFALGLGFASALAYRGVGARGSLESVAVQQPLLIDWPPLPQAPELVIAGGVAALPVPADTTGPIEDPQGSANRADREPPTEPETTAAPTPMPVPALPSRETPDDVAYREPPRPNRTPPASPRSDLALPQPGPGKAGSDPATAVQNLSPQPPVGTSGRNLQSEPPVETSGRALSPARRSAEREGGSEPSVGTPRRNPPSEPPVGTASRNLSPARPSAEREGGSEPSIQDPRESIRAVLDRYRNAYQRLDASAARSVWPAVNAGALSRAFGALSSQQIRFDSCAIAVSGASADATCNGQSRVVPKIGGGLETTNRTWQFSLRQNGADWLIEKATVK